MYLSARTTQTHTHIYTTLARHREGYKTVLCAFLQFTHSVNLSKCAEFGFVHKHTNERTIQSFVFVFYFFCIILLVLRGAF